MPSKTGQNEDTRIPRSRRFGSRSHSSSLWISDSGFWICRRPQAVRRGAFTLVELLVSVGLTAILLWGLLQLFTSATKFSSAVSTESELCAAGRSLLTRITREVTGAAPLQIGYIKIIENKTSDEVDHYDSIQFVASVASDGTQLAHVKYGPMSGNDSPRQIGRGVKIPIDTDTVLRQTDLSGLSTKVPIDLNLLGVRVEKFAISYIESGSTSVLTASKDFPSGDGKLPQAVLFEIRLRDLRSLSTITLQSAAYLAGSGL